MTNSNGHTNEKYLPWWAQLFIQVGFPTAVAILLLAAMFGWINSPLMETLKRLEAQGWHMTRVMRIICYRFSSTEDLRAQCEPWNKE